MKRFVYAEQRELRANHSSVRWIQPKEYGWSEVKRLHYGRGLHAGYVDFDPMVRAWRDVDGLFA